MNEVNNIMTPLFIGPRELSALAEIPDLAIDLYISIEGGVVASL